MKKIKTTLPYLMNEKLKEDVEHFGLQLGGIGNKIFSYYKDKEIEESNLKSEKGQTFQFNLTKENDEIYLTVLKEHGGKSDAEFLRDILFKYLNNPRYMREEILFSETFKKIKDGINEKRKLNIKYRGKIRTINPYLIKVSSGEDRSYLFCFCEENNEHRNYRISKIESVSLSKNELEYKDEEYIKNIDNNFDPFLSYGYNVVGKITKSGEELYNTAILNRPKVIEKKRMFGHFNVI